METKRVFRHKQDEVKKPYRYTACGLDSVYLLNGYKLYQLEDGEGVSVRDLEGLHRAIGRNLATQSELLKPKELRWFRMHLDLTQDKLAELLGCDSETVARWEKEEGTASERNALLIRLLYLDHIDDTAGFQALLERLKKPAPEEPDTPDSWMMDKAA
jgi:DNA-binding transcriptional regulator YiaG